MSGRKPKSVRPFDDLSDEVRKVEALIRQVSIDLGKPHLELGASMRLSIRHRELQAYLHGIRFALGEAEIPPGYSFDKEMSDFLMEGQP